MQTPDIKKLLQRKKFAGAELGKIIMMNKAQEMERWKYLTPPKPPLFTNEELQQMKQGLRTEQDRLEYNEYAHIYNLTTNLWNSSMNAFNRVFTFYWLYIEKLHKIKDTEAAFWQLESTPVVITKKEYEALKAPIEAKNRKLKRAPSQYMWEYVVQWLADFKEGEKQDANLKKAFAKLKKQKCTNKRILENFAFDTDRFHYEDATGRKVDLDKPQTMEDMLKNECAKKEGSGLSWQQMQENFFKARLERKGEEDFIGHQPRQGKPTLEDEEEAAEFLEDFKKRPFEPKHTQIGLILKHCNLEDFEDKFDKEKMQQCYCDDISMFLYIDDKESMLSALDAKKVADEVPNLNKLDALEDSGRYFYEHNGEPAEMLKEFAEDYPEIYKLLLEALEEILPATKGMSFAKLVKPLASIDDLNKKGIDWFDYIAKAENHELSAAFSSATYEGRSKRARAQSAGFAVVDEDKAIDPVELLIKSAVLDDIMANKNQSRQILELYKQNTEDLLKKLHAHNALLNIICKQYDMPFLYKSASFPLSTFKQFGRLNGIQDTDILEVYGSLYGNWEQLKAKAAFLKEVYPETIFDAENKVYEPDEALVQKVEEKLEKVKHSQAALHLLEEGMKLLPEIMGTEAGV